MHSIFFCEQQFIVWFYRCLGISFYLRNSQYTLSFFCWTSLFVAAHSSLADKKQTDIRIMQFLLLSIRTQSN